MQKKYKVVSIAIMPRCTIINLLSIYFLVNVIVRFDEVKAYRDKQKTHHFETSVEEIYINIAKIYA